MKYRDIINISIQQILIFLKCCQYLDYSRVAEEYDLTPSMVSKTIKGLEAVLGIQLFIRKYHTLELTLAGRELEVGWKNILDTGRFPYLIEYCRAYKEYTGIDTFPMFSAPWTLAGDLYGVADLVMDTMEDPEFVKALLDKIVDDLHVPMFKALAEILPGFHQVSLADAFASVPVVTPKIVREFIRPSLERLMERLQMPKINMQDTAFFGTAQLNGADRKEYEDFIIWSNDMFFCIDPDLTALTPEYARQVATDHGVPLMAGISAEQVEFGDPEETVAIVKEFILKGKKGPTPLFFFFNNLSAGYRSEWLKVSGYRKLS